MSDVGVLIALDKTVGPDTVLTFLGIEIDAVAMQARLPMEKKEAMVSLIKRMLSSEKVKVRDIQVLLGHLNFACRVVRAGRTFCRRLGLALSGLSLPHHRLRLLVGVKEALRVWCWLLEQRSGTDICRIDKAEFWDVQVY